MIRCLQLGPVMFVLLSLGCGGASAPKLVTVSGHVTMDDKPLVKAEVHFQPVGDDGKPTSGPQAYGTTDNNGDFTLQTDKKEGVAVGKYRVEINLMERGEKLINRVPEEYNVKSKTIFPVPEGGSKEANFPLKSKGK